MKFKSEQEQFWAQTYSSDYIKKNSEFNLELGIEAWNDILKKINKSELNHILECGCNVGRNINFLNKTLPNAELSVIEISDEALKITKNKYKIYKDFNGPILDCKFKSEFDLVFTMGVLIHINPEQLIDHMRKMYNFSKKYILIGEYFNRTPVSLEYQGHKDKLFKKDFGKIFMNEFNLKLIDYGFLWGHKYDNAGFDDITWWVFEK